MHVYHASNLYVNEFTYKLDILYVYIIHTDVYMQTHTRMKVHTHTHPMQHTQKDLSLIGALFKFCPVVLLLLESLISEKISQILL